MLRNLFRRAAGRPRTQFKDDPNQQATLDLNRVKNLLYYYTLSDQERWAKVVLQNSKTRARKKNLEHTLSKEDIMALLPADMTCPIMHVPLSIEKAVGVVKPYTATIDRIDNEKGYVPGNVFVICHMANRGKAQMSLEECVHLGVWAARLLKKQEK